VGPGEVPYLAVPRSNRMAPAGCCETFHEMMKSDVLSESEFRTKKWELLSTKLKQSLFARVGAIAAAV
jgi:hypothetical protein